MSELTKEWLHQTIAEIEEERDSVPGAVNEDAAMALAAMKLALASLEAEPVAWLRKPDQGFHLPMIVLGANDPNPNGEYEEFYHVYTAPSAPVSVPEWTNEQCLEFLSIAFRHAEIKGDLELNDIRLGVKMANGSRAAILHGAEHVSKRDELPEGWVACIERMPGRDYVLAADFSGKQYPANMPNIQIGIYADWFDDGCPCWDDGDGNDLHLKQVTHWTQIPAAPQQEV